MPRRQPRWPSIGLASASSAARRRIASTSVPSACATSASSASPCGRNSCSGGSSRRIVTGRPAMMRNSSMKVVALERQQLAPAPRAGRASSLAMIIWRTAPMRSGSKNMCSVRHRPMPSAPNFCAVSASSGVSALARTLRRADLVRPAHQRGEVAGHRRLDHRHRADEHLAGGAVERDGLAGAHRLAAGGQRLRVVIDRRCRRRRRRRAGPCRAPPPPRGWSCRRAWSGCRWAACMPWMSSGLVSMRTRITASPLLRARSRPRRR